MKVGETRREDKDPGKGRKQRNLKNIIMRAPAAACNELQIHCVILLLSVTTLLQSETRNFGGKKVGELFWDMLLPSISTLFVASIVTFSHFKYLMFSVFYCE